MSVRLVDDQNCLCYYASQEQCKNTHAHFSQLSNRLGSARCGADLILPSAVARTGEQAIIIEGRNTASVHIVAIEL